MFTRLFSVSSTLSRYQRNEAAEIYDRIMFVFYPGLPHMYVQVVDPRLSTPPLQEPGNEAITTCT